MLAVTAAVFVLLAAKLVRHPQSVAAEFAHPISLLLLAVALLESSPASYAPWPAGAALHRSSAERL